MRANIRNNLMYQRMRIKLGVFRTATKTLYEDRSTNGIFIISKLPTLNIRSMSLLNAFRT